MSESIKHECGIALIRFRKDIDYYIKKYGTPSYGLNKLYLLMEKQHNRGQDGTGVATLKLGVEPGVNNIDRVRSIDNQPIKDIFQRIGQKVEEAKQGNEELFSDPNFVKNNVPFIGDIYMGHLRYGTHGKNSIENCHPLIRHSNWKSKTLVLAGNFNMTNVDELFQLLVRLGQHPKLKADTVTVLEKIGHFLDMEHDSLKQQFSDLGYQHQDAVDLVEKSISMKKILKRSCQDFDGGYAMIGSTGYGTSFVARDPAGIRPAYYYYDDEVVVIASEKAAIKTAFNANYEDIHEVKRGCALIIDAEGNFEEKRFFKKLPKKSCSFERIYFSRGTDPKIYNERKNLGRQLIPQILKSIDYDLENTVFSYIPNTAETAFLGMTQGLDDYLTAERLKALKEKKLSNEELEKLFSIKPRIEKLVIKDAKMRTFITDDDNRDDLVAHVYDTTYEIVKKNVDTIVVIDDSIVRGTTLEKSIINMLDKLKPKRIVVVSSAPQIRYPDCYGIDMSKMHEFVAFRAMLNLLKKTGKNDLLKDVYKQAKTAYDTGTAHEKNYVKILFDQFTDEEISDEVAKIIKLSHVKADIKVIFQKVEDLHTACPDDLGDWYFTGNYPTPGGNKVVNKSFINFFEGKKERAY